ncbi:MAG: tape measure protein [Bacteroidetes bacterium]|nr:tape measure protein [Bacteroidota bacterium]
MAERVEFEFSLKNLFSPAINKAASDGKKAFDSLDKESAEFSKHLKDNKVNADAVGSSLSGLKSLAGKAFAALAIGETVKSMANLSIEAEQNKIAFTTFLGSVDAANASLKELKHFAAVTPFSSRQVIDVSKALLGFGVQAKDLQPTLKALGDVSSGTGKDFKELAVIFGQIKSVGHLMGGDLMQLRQAGVPIVAELGKNLGKTDEQIVQMVHDGAIGFKDVEHAFQTMSSKGGMFFDLMQKQSESLGGRLSTLGDNFEVLGTQIGDNFIAPVIARFVNFTNEFLDNIQPVKEAFGNLFTALSPIGDAINELGIAFGLWTKEGLNGATVAQNFANALNTYVVPAAKLVADSIKFVADVLSEYKVIVYSVLGAYVAFQTASLAVAAVTKIVTAAQWLLNAALTANPIGIVIVAIGALVGAFVYAWNEIEGFKEGILAFWEAAKYAFTNLGTFIPKVLSNIAKFFTDTFKPFFEAIDAFKRGDYGEAAKLAGKGLLLSATIPQRLIYETVTGDIFKGTGADEVFNNTKSKLLREKREAEAKKKLEELNKGFGNVQKGNETVTPTLSSGGTGHATGATGHLKDAAVRVGSAPQSVTVNLHFNKDSFHYEVNSVVESQTSVEHEFARILASIGNMTQHSFK